MFRKMRRFNQQISDGKCKDILKKEWRGVLSLLGDDDYPYGVPMNFYYDEDEQIIYFHGALEGHKIDAIKRHDKASFTVYDKGYHEDGHWSLNITSVIAFGRISVVEDRQTAEEKLRLLGEKYFPSSDMVDSEMNAYFHRTACIELKIEHMTGKLINES